MISLGLQKLLIRSYVGIKLSLLFWLYAFSGLLLFGIGPALLTVAELYHRHHWHYDKITLAEGWQLFKSHFKLGNLYLYLFAGITIILAYNLFLSVQTQGLIFIITDFILIFALLILVSMFHFGIWLQARYKIALATTLKLSFIQFFNNFLEVLKLLAGFVAIMLITYKFPGLLLFGTVPALLLWTAYVSKKWYAKLETVI